MLPSGTNTSNPCSFTRPTVSVTNTGTVLINSLILKKIEITFNTYTNSVYTRTIIEKIGANLGFLFPSLHCIVDGSGYGDFIYYEDPSFPIYKKVNTSNCNYDPTSIKNHKNDNMLQIFPNPVRTNFILEQKRVFLKQK